MNKLVPEPEKYKLEIALDWSQALQSNLKGLQAAVTAQAAIRRRQALLPIHAWMQNQDIKWENFDY